MKTTGFLGTMVVNVVTGMVNVDGFSGISDNSCSSNLLTFDNSWLGAIFAEFVRGFVRGFARAF